MVPLRALLLLVLLSPLLAEAKKPKEEEGCARDGEDDSEEIAELADVAGRLRSILVAKTKGRMGGMMGPKDSDESDEAEGKDLMGKYFKRIKVKVWPTKS